jgi:hypothetical protein
MEIPDTLVLCSPSDVAVVGGMPSTSVVGVAVGWGSSPRGHCLTTSSPSVPDMVSGRGHGWRPLHNLVIMVILYFVLVISFDS